MQFFTAVYWFGFPPMIGRGYLTALIIFGCVLLIGGIVFGVLYKRIRDRLMKQVALRGARAAVWIGVLVLVHTFMRFERIPVFMNRYWLLVIAIISGIWLFRISRYADRRRDQLDEETRIFHEREKYLH